MVLKENQKRHQMVLNISFTNAQWKGNIMLVCRWFWTKKKKIVEPLHFRRANQEQHQDCKRLNEK